MAIYSNESSIIKFESIILIEKLTVMHNDSISYNKKLLVDINESQKIISLNYMYSINLIDKIISSNSNTSGINNLILKDNLFYTFNVEDLKKFGIMIVNKNGNTNTNINENRNLKSKTENSETKNHDNNNSDKNNNKTDLLNKISWMYEYRKENGSKLKKIKNLNEAKEVNFKIEKNNNSNRMNVHKNQNRIVLKKSNKNEDYNENQIINNEETINLKLNDLNEVLGIFDCEDNKNSNIMLKHFDKNRADKKNVPEEICLLNRKKGKITLNDYEKYAFYKRYCENS